MKNKKFFYLGLGSLLAFSFWTLLLCYVDTKPIGPNGSVVGLSMLNQFIHNLTGVNMTLYSITDWSGLVPVFIAFGFALLGLFQWIKRRKITKVDYSILALGVFYIAVTIAYLLFERVVINYRPVLINGYLEVSYPSSTTLLVMCVMPTALMQFNRRIKNKVLNKFVSAIIIFFIAFMVIGRVVSGVHWITDIIGGALLSTGLVAMYYWAISLKKI